MTHSHESQGKGSGESSGLDKTDRVLLGLHIVHSTLVICSSLRCDGEHGFTRTINDQPQSGQKAAELSKAYRSTDSLPEFKLSVTLGKITEVRYQLMEHGYGGGEFKKTWHVIFNSDTSEPLQATSDATWSFGAGGAANIQDGDFMPETKLVEPGGYGNENKWCNIVQSLETKETDLDSVVDELQFELDDLGTKLYTMFR